MTTKADPRCAAGLFSHRTTGPGRAFLNARRQSNDRAARERLERLAEAFAAIAPGDSIASVGRRIGLGASLTEKLFRQIRRELGWQAQ